jgi:DNA-binding CsgD family transcriptional regulator
MGKSAVRVSDVRQLCGLGLPAQEVMPSLLATLHRFIPSYTNLFDWVDDKCQISNYYSEGPACPDSARLYFEEFYNKREQEVMPAFSDHIRTARGVINSVFTPAFYRSDFYNEIWRPRQVHHKLEAIIRQHERPLGSLVLYRRADEPPFSRREEQLLSRVIPYIAHAVAHGGEYQGQYDASGETGLVVANERGAILYSCPQGRRLLYLATHATVDPRTVVTESESPDVTYLLGRLACALVDIDRGVAAAPPVLHHRNGWGTFVFHAHWLEEAAESGKGLIGVTVERRVPFPLRIAHALQEFPLSTRQKELCAFLAQGGTYSGIATLMHLSEHTVVSYARVIYDKLGLSGRDKLVRKLLAPAEALAPRG